jgi:TPR repeat protein
MTVTTRMRGFAAAILALLGVVAFAVPGWAGPIEDGVAAIDRKDFAAAARHFTAARDAGNLQGDYHLGYMAFAGEGRAVDRSAAADLWRRAADRGMILAQINLALLYRGDLGVPADLPQVRALLQGPAAKGEDRSLVILAMMMARGEGGPVDIEGADLMIQRARSENKETAGPVLEELRAAGLLPDHSALRWQEQRDARALAGDSDALFLLGSDYLHGEGVAQDKAAAARWFAASADKGNAMAQMALAALLTDADSPLADFVRARELVIAAANQGHPDALWSIARNVGCCMKKPADQDIAATAAILAFWNGAYEVGLIRLKLMNGLSPARQRAVQARAEECHKVGIAVCGLFDTLVFPAVDGRGQVLPEG